MSAAHHGHIHPQPARALNSFAYCDGVCRPIGYGGAIPVEGNRLKTPLQGLRQRRDAFRHHLVPQHSRYLTVLGELVFVMAQDDDLGRLAQGELYRPHEDVLSR